MSDTNQNLNRAHIELSSQCVLLDEAVGIRLSGFPETTRVDVTASMRDDVNRMWSSQASFRTDASGAVDLSCQAPENGDYDTADSMGLVWSLALAPEEPNQSLFAKTGLDPTIITFTASSADETVASETLKQLHISPDVERIPVRDDVLRGTYFKPAGQGPFPAVIVVGGSGGGLQEGHAALFASRGIAAFALAYFAFDDLPKHLIDIPLEYFKAAIDWIGNRQEIDENRLALVGKSRGAEVALQVGSLFPEVRAVIGYVPSHVIWSGIGDAGRGEVFAWTHHGKGIPFMPNRMSPSQAAEIFSKPQIPLTPMFLINLEDSEAVERVSIPVERISGPVLLISGLDDQMWPSAMMGHAVMQRLEDRGHPYVHKHLAYPDAGHMILMPYLPTTRNASQHPVTHQTYAFGGTPKGCAEANVDSWTQVLDFLRTAFPERDGESA